uniref:Uncharacterized protein n=1 Tax=viral metagenome TaxID=1070528 RepID=A0A6C0H9R4_9ZZZZ
MNFFNNIYYMYEIFYKIITIINDFSIESKNIIDAYGGFGDES